MAEATVINGISVFKDGVGEKHFSLTVIGARFRIGKRYHVVVKCDCGKFKIVDYWRIRTPGRPTRTCGKCKDCTKTQTAEYRIWIGLRKRCLNPTHKDYGEYGGRGITVCERWQRSFQNFMDDMGGRPSCFHSVDRRNNDGPYSPENCRWATPSEQAMNRRTTKLVEINGETHSLQEWATIMGVELRSISSRINTYGWAPEKAILTPVKKYARSSF